MEEIECLYIKKKITFKRKSDYFDKFVHRIGATDCDIDLLIVEKKRILESILLTFLFSN